METYKVPLKDERGKITGLIALSLDLTERKRAQEALRESEERFRSAFENAPIGMALNAPDGRYLRVNRSLCEMLDYSEDELLTKSLQAITYADDLEITRSGLKRMLDGEISSWQIEKRYSHKRGHIVWGRLSASLIRDSRGQPDYFIAQIEDITARKKAEEALLESERKYRELVDSLPEPVFEMDEKGRITFANRSARETLGSAEGVPGEDRYAWDSLAGKDLWRGERDIRRGLIGEDPGGGEYEFRRKDGSTFPALVYANHIVRDGKFVGMRGLIVDISERKRAEEERERRLAREQALARIGEALVSEVELERVANVVMEQSLKVLGVDAVRLWLANRARRELRLLAQAGPAVPEDRTPQSFDAPFLTAKAATTEQMQIIEGALAGQDPAAPCREFGSESGMRSMLAMPLLSRGHLIGVLTCLNERPRQFSLDDVDFNRTMADLFAVAIENARLHRSLGNRERQIELLLKETIEAQEKERQRICLEVHDGVAQTLTAASHYLQALDGHPGLAPGFNSQVHSAGTLVREAIREVRDVMGALRPAALDALGLVETLRYELGDIGARTGLRVDFDADSVRFPGNIETALYRIVREAITNVTKHACASAMAVRIREEDHSVVILVEDDGVGFDPLALEDQVNPRGLGLISMRKRAELLGGRVVIRSNPGQGTQVHLEVPLFTYGPEPDVFEDGVRLTPQEEMRHRRRRTDPITVLIVDDHVIARQGLRAVLESSQSVQVVGEASDGLEAIKAVAELGPRVVLMDIRMPNLDGLEATRQIKAEYPTTAVIAMTNYDDDAMVVSAVQAGAASYLLKDSTRELLFHTIGAVVSGGTLIEASLFRRAFDNLARSHSVVSIAAEDHPEVQKLSERERQVLELLPKGWTNKEISKHLVISEATVKKHVQSIIAKLRASDRTHAAILALRLGLVD